MIDANKLSLNFILSTGRTGSTLLSTMLNMHPNIMSVSEEPFAYNLYPKYKNITNWTDETIEQFCYDFYLFSEGKLEPQFGTKQDLFNILKENQSSLTGINAIKLTYFAFFPNKNKSEITTIVDKGLKFHIFLEEVEKFYPSSKFVVLSRDPRDNVLIKLKRALKKNKKQTALFLAETWDYEYRTLLKKLAQINPDRYIKVRYEDLVSAPEITLKKITDFLNLPYNEDMMKYDDKYNDDLKKAENKISDTVKKHFTLFHEGLGEKVNTNKIGRWRFELSEKDNNLIWAICHETAKEFGYLQEECVVKKYFNLSMITEYIRFYFGKRFIPYIYYSSPYSIKYLAKKVLHGRNFEHGQWTTKDFYKTTLPKS
jgi:hypothetical protein